MHLSLLDALLMAQLSLEPVFGWWAVIPLAGIMLASLWLTFSVPGITLRGRLLLGLLRCGAVLILLLGWLRPGFITTTERESSGAIAVLLDRSRSMTLPSNASGQNRWQVQQNVWSAIVSATDLKLGEARLIPYFYEQALSAIDQEDLPSLEKSFATAPNGQLTDLGKALSQVTRQQIDPPLRGVIMLGDGVQTDLPAEIDASIVARQMGRLDQPILFVGIGPRGEKSQVRDVAISGLPEEFTAFVKKRISVPLVVESQGMQNQPVQVELTLRASGASEQVIASREILPSQSEERLPIEFQVELPESGDFLLEARATVDAREQIKTNNVATSFLTVREGGAKILYLTGEQRAEFKFLNRSFDASVEFEVDHAWLPKKERARWPRDLNRSINFDQYDVFVLGDLDASAISSSSLQLLANRIRRGAGLLLLGGYHSFDAGGYGRTALATAFPVELSMPRSQSFDRAVDPFLHITDDIVLQPTRPHPITNLAPEPENTQLWRSLKPLKGMNRLGRPKSSPGVQVLLESQDEQPVLVTGEYGNGRVLAFAGDTTWQWWLAGRKKVHQQFWRQAVLWLLRRDSLQEGFRLEMDRRRLMLDETPELAIEWFGGSDNTPMPEAVKVELSRDGRWLQNLSTERVGPQSRQAEITGLNEPGLYKLVLTVNADASGEQSGDQSSDTGSDGGPEAYRSELSFIVRDESRELTRTAPDWQMMENIAAANDVAGGRLILPEEVGEALDWFRQRQNDTKVVTVEKRRLGDAAWDAWLYLTLFCILLSIEWGLRKSWQLP